MIAQLIVWFYGSVSILVIAFNIASSVWGRLYERLLARWAGREAERFEEEVARSMEEGPSEGHLARVERRLRTLSGMESFDRVMEALGREDPGLRERYLARLAPVFDHLALRAPQGNVLRSAFASYLARRWYRADAPSEALMTYLRGQLSAPAVYARLNAFEAIVGLGSPNDIVHGLRDLGATGLVHSRRLASEALLDYRGDRDELASALLGAFPGLPTYGKLCVLSYLRLAHVGRYGVGGNARRDRWRLVRDVMSDEHEDREVRLACIRFFRSNVWMPVAKPLAAFARSGTGEWEFAAVAATALASYPGADTVRALKGCLSSPVYQVRFNAARSLYELGLSLEDDLADVLEGPDRYARDMLRYRWQVEEGIL